MRLKAKGEQKAKLCKSIAKKYVKKLKNKYRRRLEKQHPEDASIIEGKYIGYED